MIIDLRKNKKMQNQSTQMHVNITKKKRFFTRREGGKKLRIQVIPKIIINFFTKLFVKQNPEQLKAIEI